MSEIMMPREVTILRECPIDLWEVEREVRKFYLSIPINLEKKDNELSISIMKCVRYSNSAINLVWGLFKKEDLDIEEYDKCELNLGRIRKHIIKTQKNLINLSSDEKTISEVTSSLSIMDEAISLLCVHCFLRVKKDVEIKNFLKLLFMEFSNFVSYLGALTGEEVTTPPKFPTEIKLKPSLYKKEMGESEEEKIIGIGEPKKEEMTELEEQEEGEGYIEEESE